MIKNRMTAYITRREFTVNSVLWGLGVLFCSPIKALSAPLPTETSEYASLNDHQVKTLEAVCERFIPTDQDPGAVAAGVISYIDNEMTEYNPGLKKVYEEGLASLDQYCLSHHDSYFADLSLERQHRVLEEIERAQSGEGESSFFETVLAHTFEGYYGHPKYGGNKDFVGWKVAGYA